MVGNLNGVKSNERVVKCSWVKFKFELLLVHMCKCNDTRCLICSFKKNSKLRFVKYSPHNKFSKCTFQFLISHDVGLQVSVDFERN